MEKNAAFMKPLVLAYIGDSVYSVYVKRKLIEESDENVYPLHIKTCAFVKASAQATVLKGLWDSLSEQEQDVARRGRNAHSHTVPKNADVTDYRYATGFEALIGYLYLSEMNERLEEVLSLSYGYMKEIIERKKNEKRQ